jgi:hypothetical protein
MKTLIASLLLALIVSTSSLTYATTPNSTLPIEASVIVRPQIMKLDIITQASDYNYITIRLRDAQGHTLIKTKVNKSEKASLSRFDVSNLADGIYQVEISDGTSKQIKEFAIETTIPAATSLRSVSLS